jgi:hypothetical protein
MYFHSKFCIHSSYGSLIITVKLKTKLNFDLATMLFYICFILCKILPIQKLCVLLKDCFYQDPILTFNVRTFKLLGTLLRPEFKWP